MNKTIFITCPIHQREIILPHYLQHIHSQDYPKQNIELYFIVNNCIDNSLKILQEFKLHNDNEYKKITIDIYNNSKIPNDERVDKIREKIYYWLAELRNKTLDKFIKSDCDYYLSCDSDIMMRPDCIKRFLEHKFDYLSGLIYNSYCYKSDAEIIEGLEHLSQAERFKLIIKEQQRVKEEFNFKTAYKFPNVLKWNGQIYVHIVNNRIKNPHAQDCNYKLNVDFTGAIFILDRKVAENKNCRFDFHKQGEDEPFCRSIKKEGFKIECLPSNFNYHIMHPNLLPLYYEGKLHTENN